MFFGGSKKKFGPSLLAIFDMTLNITLIYDFLIKGGILGEIGLVQFLIDCALMSKNVGEMIYVPKDSIFDVLQSEIKIFVVVHT